MLLNIDNIQNNNKLHPPQFENKLSKLWSPNPVCRIFGKRFASACIQSSIYSGTEASWPWTAKGVR